MRARVLIAVGVAALLLLAWALQTPYVQDLRTRFMRPRTVAERVAQYGRAAHLRLVPEFAEAGVGYPPARFELVALKREHVIDLYAGNNGQGLRFIRTYPVLASSGKLGPKLRSGDRQVPEGSYAIASLNPNSRYHLALQLGYPNEFDRMHAAEDGRTDLGGDIMIHGSDVSISCLAVGDEASEELFVLAAETGLKRGRVLVCPVDFRRSGLPADFRSAARWTPELYADLREQLAGLPPAVRGVAAD